MRKFAAFLLGLLSFQLCVSQENNFNRSPVTLQSPDASQIIRYADIPVDYSTGIPNISVDLYRVTAGSVSLPIDMSYNASGIKVLDIAGTLGLGWTLNAGGLVSKTVLGTNDLFTMPRPDFNSLFNAARSSTTYNSVCSFTSAVTEAFSLRNETQSDRYSFNFNGRSGVFRPDFETGVAKTIPYSPLKIVINRGGTYKITDENGTNYYFEQPELSGSFPGATPVYTSYYLTKIETADLSHAINISYKQDQEVTQFIKSYQLEKSVGTTDNPAYGPFITTKLRNNEFISQSVPVMPDSITSDNEAILFQYVSDRVDPRKSRLTGIIILDRRSRQVIKSIGFNHSYFGTAADGNQRLKLDGLNIKDSKNTDVQKYSFEYNGLALPPYYKTLGMSEHHNVDFWGYYNGADDPNLLPRELFNALPPTINLPSSSQFTYDEQRIYGGDRNPNPITSQACILTALQYPTGGKVSFEYELNQVANGYSYPSGPAPYFGGLRVKKITRTADEVSPPQVKSYTYYGGFHTMMQNELFLSNTTSTAIGKTVGTLSDGTPVKLNVRYEKTIMNTDPFLPMSTGHGPIVAYDNVREYEGTESNNNGYTEYIYDNDGIPYEFYDPGSHGDPSYWGYYVTDYGNFKPQLKAKVYVGKGLNLTYKELKREDYSYSKFNQGSFSTGLKIQRNNPYELTGFGTDCDVATSSANPQAALAHLISEYQLTKTIGVLDVPLLTATKETLHPSSGAADLVLTTSISYDLVTLTPILEQRSTSNSDLLVTLKKYPKDFTEEPYASMVTKNILSPVIEQSIYKNEVSDANLLTSTRTNYGFWDPINLTPTVSNFIMPKTIDTREKGQTAYKTRQRFFSYDAKANVLSFSKENDVLISYIWNDTKTYPVAQATNAKYNEIFFEGFEEGSIWPNVVGGWPDMAVDNSRTHTGGYAGKIFNPNNYILYYHSHQWLQIALTAPTKYKYSGWFYSDGPQVALYLFMKRAGETGYLTYVDATTTTNTGNWVYLEKEFEVPADVVQLNVRVDNYGGGSVWFDDIRLHPSTAKMTTYTYAPLIGMTSQSDINSRPTYYEYDLFGRLYLVRDFDKNILKKYCYNYAGQTSSCAIFGNEPQTQTFTKVCTSGIGSQVAYTVAADTYSAGTQSEANALAIKDIEANGQAFANQQGTCTAPPPPVNVNISGNNYSSAGYYVYFLEVTTNQSYSMYLPAGSSATLTLLSGNYKVSFTPAGTAVNASFRVNGYSTYGTTATFNNITIGNGTQVVIN